MDQPHLGPEVGEGEKSQHEISFQKHWKKYLYCILQKGQQTTLHAGKCIQKLFQTPPVTKMPG